MYAELGYILVNRVEREGHFYALRSLHPFLMWLAVSMRKRIQ